MKSLEEIYKVKFGNILENGNTQYFFAVVGEKGFVYHDLVTPEKISVKGDKITISFAEKTKMVIKYSDEVQLFYKEIEKTDGATTIIKPAKRAVKKRKNTIKSYNGGSRTNGRRKED